MVERRWPTLAEALADIECDILDERMLRVRPTPEERELIRAEAEAYLAERRAAQKPAAPGAHRRGGQPDY